MKSPATPLSGVMSVICTERLMPVSMKTACDAELPTLPAVSITRTA